MERLNGEICDNCQPLFVVLQDQLAGKDYTIASLQGKIGKLQREDPDKKLREHAEWDRFVRLFKAWQRATDHTRSRPTVGRFRISLPFLEQHEDEMILRGIEGIAYDPWVRSNRNGTKERVDGWADLFKNDEEFERFCNKAPTEWKDNLEEHAVEIMEARRF